MLEKNNKDSSSSEDEVYKSVLKEATDHQFLKDVYFSENSAQNSTKTNKCNDSIIVKDPTNVKSLRPNLKQNDKFENFGVSPTFQKFVAKKLDEILEKSITFKTKDDNSLMNSKLKQANNNGIKLLASSNKFLVTEEQSEEQMPPKRHKTNNEVTEENVDLAKCKEAAVDPDWVLSKIDTKAWTSKRKEPEFKYKKMKNGTLIEHT